MTIATEHNLINAAECPHRNRMPSPSLKCACGKDSTLTCDLRGRFVDFHTALPPYECPIVSESDWKKYYLEVTRNGRTA